MGWLPKRLCLPNTECDNAEHPGAMNYVLFTHPSEAAYVFMLYKPSCADMSLVTHNVGTSH